MLEEERRQEEGYFAQVQQIIEDNLQKRRQAQQELKAQVQADRADMWADNRHLIRDFDDVILLSEQDRQVAESERKYAENQKEIARLEKMAKSPYFGRLDLREGAGGRTLYIGIHSLKKEDAFRLYVVDWRAPVSALYYNFDLGPGWYEAQGERHPVDITLKRQFHIEQGRMVQMYDADSVMHDEILGAALSQNTTNRLRVIIGSIQKEQNAAIRSSARQSCLIYGLAGSGKTSVGLHRLAWLLYQERESLRAENILILANNRVFSSYISNILPDLGEEEARTLVVQELLEDHLGKGWRVENGYQQLRELTEKPASPRADGLKIKYSPDFLEFCEKSLAEYAFRMPEVRFRGRVILSQALFDKAHGQRRYSTFRANRELAEGFIRKGVEDFFMAHREVLCRELEEGSEEFLTHREVLARFRAMERQCLSEGLQKFRAMNLLEAREQLPQLLLQWSGDSGESKVLRECLRKKRLRYEDGLLYLYVRLLMGETAPDRTVRHTVIDEAQDSSPLQLRVLKLLFPDSRFTLLADVCQAVEPLTTMSGYELFSWVFDGRLDTVRLDKCYRSSAEICALAFAILSKEDPALTAGHACFGRSTQKPRYVVSRRPMQTIRAILKELEGYNTVAVITTDGKQAARVKRAIPEAQLITSPHEKLEGRVVILPLLLAKGLEFDGVILLDCVTDSRKMPGFYRRVYLGCTRALHELYLVEREKLPAELADCAPLVELEERA